MLEFSTKLKLSKDDFLSISPKESLSRDDWLWRVTYSGGALIRSDIELSSEYKVFFHLDPLLEG